jgi:N-acetylglucosaminyldiphosphoundecaprenol N-acetyl-beta-D-mannosaminyltransferase
MAEVGTKIGSPSRVRIMDATIGAVTEADAVRWIVDAAAARRGSWTITANLDHLRRYQDEPAAKELIDDADLVVADGLPLVWASQLAGTPLPERVAGSNMVWSLCEQASRREIPVFLLGGNPGTAVRAAAVLRKRFPGLEVAATLCPPFGFEANPVEIDFIRRRVGESGAGIVLVGLGFPKQDLLIRRLRESSPEASFVGVGVSFSFVAGELMRAPAWAGALGVEWLFRLFQEPRRLLRRYLVDGAPFALRLLGHATRHRFGWRPSDERWGWAD